MSFIFKHLNEVRHYMLEEFDSDVNAGKLYSSKRFTPDGETAWPELLRKAIELHDEDWLSTQIDKPGYFKAGETKTSVKVGYTVARTPVTKHTTIGHDQFNRYYIRGVCRKAIDDRTNDVRVIRGKPVSDPRVDSTLLEGEIFSAESILADLRENMGRTPKIGVPAGPNSGITVELV